MKGWHKVGPSQLPLHCVGVKHGAVNLVKFGIKSVIRISAQIV